jgi:riboflavin synthase
MFTGIVEETGALLAREETADGLRLRIGGSETTGDLAHGQSVAVSGACLTVEDAGEDWFEVFLASETVAKTYLGDLAVGDPVNLERALRADARLDGHFVQGHVDGVTEVTGVETVGEDGEAQRASDRADGDQPSGGWFFEFALPEERAPYVVQKGSIALDGVSLTVAELTDDRFRVAVIPTTYDLTTLGAKAVGDPVHLEVDVIAKYVESLTEGYRE